MTNKLYEQIGNFYDNSSQLWEKTWGEHMHHGYYGKNGNYKLDRRHAQINLIEELLSYARVNNVSNFLDVGCGIGGSSLYLAEKFNAHGIGISLSSFQVSRATERAMETSLAERVHFKKANALEMPFEDNSFDLVWSLESGEHMPDKTKFLAECYRVLKPEGKLILATWCHRPTTSLSGELTEDEKRHLKMIYDMYYLPYVISLPDYVRIFTNLGFNNIQADDWSIAVAPFWDSVMDSALNPQAIIGLFQSGWETVVGALAVPLMRSGYERGLIRYGVVCASKSG